MEYPQSLTGKPDTRRAGPDPRDLDDEDGMVVAWIVAAIALYLVVGVGWAIARVTGFV